MSQLKFLKAKIQQALLRCHIWLKRRIVLQIILGIIIVGVSGLVFAKVEPVIYLTGQLKPQEKVQKILLPQDSVINQIYVQQGEQIQKGQRLLSFNVINSLTKLKNC